MDLSNEQLEGLSLALDEAALLEVCVDPVLRRADIVFQVFTLPEDDLMPRDRVVHLILNNIVRIAASLTKTADDDTKRLNVLPLTIDKLEETVKSFDGLAIYGADCLQGNNINKLPKWFDYVSLDVQSDVNDGKTYTLDLFQIGNHRRLDIRIWFQELRLEKNGKLLEIDEFIAGGKRWWNAFNKNSFRTEGYGIIPLNDPPKDNPPKPN